MNSEKKWHIIFTRQGAEKKVCDQLHKRKIEHFFSTFNWYNNIENKSRQIIKPLFERKVFVFIDENEFDLVKSLDGVLQFVHWHNSPAILKPAEITTLKNFTQVNKNIRVEKINVDANCNMATVYIKTNSTQSVSRENTDVIKAMLPSMGISLVANIMRESSEILSVVRTRYLTPNLING